MSKAVLAVVAAEPGLNLTALVERIGRTPGAVRDYLQWLVGVDALSMVRKRYSYIDGLLGGWVRLHARGIPPSGAELEAALRETLSGPAPEAASQPAEAAAPGRTRADSLMEID
jgi:hypothetical protein